MEIFKQHKAYQKGASLVVLAWFLFSTSNLLARKVAPMTTVSTMLFFRLFFGFILIIPFIMKDFYNHLKLSRFSLVMIRAITIALNAALVYIAVQRIPLVDVALLINTTPFFVPLVAFVWLKVRFQSIIWIPIITGFLGLLLILRPGKEIFDIGAFFALFAGFCAAIALVTLRQMANEKTEAVLFYTLFFAFLITLPFTVMNFKIEGIKAFWMLLTIGVISTLGQWALFEAVQYAKASLLAPFGYSSIIFSSFYDYFFYGLVPTWISILGIMLVCASGILLLILVPKDYNK